MIDHDNRIPTARDRRVMRKVCPGCRHNRYNRGKGYTERAGIDAPVTCHMCWHVPTVRYDRSKCRYACGIGDLSRLASR